MGGFIDLHRHVLPGLDDGPTELAVATELCLSLEKIGFSCIHPTPHQKARSWAPSTGERETAAAALRASLAAAGAALTIAEPGGENMWDDLFFERQADGSYPHYQGGRAFLVELAPATPPPGLMDRLFHFRLQGQLPVLAHVERYLPLTANMERTEALATKAALLVNLPALGGQGGWRVRSRARKLVRSGLIHAAATDAHSPRDVGACRAGIAWLRAHVGEEGVQRLLVDGPRRILAGEL